jgi:hypothetical protein
MMIENSKITDCILSVVDVPTQKIIQKNEWFKLLQNGPNVPTSPYAMMEAFGAIQSMLFYHDYNDLNTLFQLGDVKKMTPLAMTGLLRYAFCGRNNIPYWKTFLENVRAELIERKENADLILRGL